jgi:tellurium resistance protein TerD
MSTTTAGINLQKGEKVDLTKSNPGLKIVCIGMGWDLKDGKVFDLDAYALLCKDGKLIDPNDGNKSICFFNNLTLPGVSHSGDNRTGAGDGDDETITIEFAKLPAECNEIYIGVNIYNDASANFGQVEKSFCRAYNGEDATKADIIRYDLNEDFGRVNNIIFGKLYQHNGEWKFQALGDPKTGTIADVADTYK